MLHSATVKRYLEAEDSTKVTVVRTDGHLPETNEWKRQEQEFYYDCTICMFIDLIQHFIRRPEQN